MVLMTQKEEIVKLFPEQMEMLMMSDADIAGGNVVSEAELDKQDSQWMYWKLYGPQPRCNTKFHFSLLEWEKQAKKDITSKKNQ